MGTNLVTTAGPAIERGGDLVGLVSNLAAKAGFFIDEIHRLPRIVEELLYPAMEADGAIAEAVARDALVREGVDARGLDKLDRRFLEAIVDVYGGGPVGLEAVAATINAEAETLSEIVEPYLLKIGFVAREPRGRRVTREAYAHLGKQPPAGQAPGQSTLF